MRNSPRSAAELERLKSKPTWLISRAQLRSSSLLNEAFEAKADGLRSYHYRLLAALAEQGPASQADLGRLVALDRSDVTAALSELEDQNLIERSVDPVDRRRNVVSISRDGAKRLRTLDRIVADTQTKVLAPLSPTEQRQFLKLIERLAHAD